MNSPLSFKGYLPKLRGKEGVASCLFSAFGSENLTINTDSNCTIPATVNGSGVLVKVGQYTRSAEEGWVGQVGGIVYYIPKGASLTYYNGYIIDFNCVAGQVSAYQGVPLNDPAVTEVQNSYPAPLKAVVIIPSAPNSITLDYYYNYSHPLSDQPARGNYLFANLILPLQTSTEQHM